MYGEFLSGGQFPRPEDIGRLKRYAQARVLFEGRHHESVQAKRIEEKLRNVLNSRGHAADYTAEGIVYLIYNLCRLICLKFADLQVLQTPLVLIEDDAAEEAFRDRLTDDIPTHWAMWHETLQLKRALGDAVVTVGLRDGQLSLRLSDPDRWFPVLDPNDTQTITSHQLAWIESHTVNGKTHSFLRVDVCEPDSVRRLAFEVIERDEKPLAYSVRGHGAPPEPHQTIDTYDIKEEVQPDAFSELWPGLEREDRAALGGIMPCVHIRNGRLETDLPFGRPEFYDSGALVDDINWRLAAWSDVNDKISNPPHIIPDQYLEQDENGKVHAPSRYTAIYTQQSRSGDAGEVPKYMTIENYDHATLKEQFEASVIALLVRHEISPALLGIQFGLQKESGEAKSLGMGTTEAATRRDLLETQPTVDRALTALARLSGDESVNVTTFWRVGLPKSQDELMAELGLKQSLGLITKRQMIEELYPFMDSDQIDATLAELDAEKQKEIEQMSPAFATKE